jgi:DNA-binding NarL/FixJ family response regulator
MSKRILVADDSDITRKITRLFLEVQLGFEVCGEAVDGTDAIEKAKELKPDLIVLDLAMPRMNGIEAARVIKGMMPQMLIVLFTLYEETVGNALVSAVGIDAVLSKPDGGWKLVECVRTLLQRAQIYPKDSSEPRPGLRTERFSSYFPSL